MEVGEVERSDELEGVEEVERIGRKRGTRIA